MLPFRLRRRPAYTFIALGRPGNLPVSGCLPAIVMPGRPRSYPPAAQCEWPVMARPAMPSAGEAGGAGWPAGLVRPGGGRAGGQGAVKLAAGADVEHGEGLAQVVPDRARTDEQPGADLRARYDLAGQPRDLGLLEAERELQVHERARVAGELCGAGG